MSWMQLQIHWFLICGTEYFLKNFPKKAKQFIFRSYFDRKPFIDAFFWIYARKVFQFEQNDALSLNTQVASQKLTVGDLKNFNKRLIF